MTQLLEVCRDHLPAIERDLVVANYHLYDVGDRLSWPEFIAFVLEAPPITATSHSRRKGWHRQEELLATLIEFMGGQVSVDARFARDGVPPEQTIPYRPEADANATPAAPRGPQGPPEPYQVEPQPRQVRPREARLEAGVSRQMLAGRAEYMTMVEFEKRQAAKKPASEQPDDQVSRGGVHAF